MEEVSIPGEVEPEEQSDSEEFYDCSADARTALLQTQREGTETLIVSMDQLNVESEAFEKLVRKIQCSVCENPCPPGNNYVCENGHFTCGTCHPKVVFVCAHPVDEIDGEEYGCCSSGLIQLSEAMYKHIYENYKLIARCEYWKLGCNVKDELEKVNAHTGVCPYRQVLGCPYAECPQGGLSVHLLVGHLADSHDVLILNDQTDSRTFYLQKIPADQKNHLWIPAVFTNSGCHFLLTIEARGSKIRMWFYKLERLETDSDPEIMLMGEREANKTLWEAWNTKVVDYLIPNDCVDVPCEKDREQFMKIHTQDVQGQPDLFQIRIGVRFEKKT